LRFLLVCSLIAAGTALAQDWKGKATLSGTVTDPAGKAISGAQVTLTFVDLKTGTETTTNGKGEWEVKNVANGNWVVRIAKEGFEQRESPVEVGGPAKNPHLDVRLAPVGSGNANAALAEGDQKARALVAEKKYAEARAIYQDLLAKFPKAVRIHIALAQTYDGEGQFAQAVDELKKYLDTDPSNQQIAGFYAGENAKAGNPDEALRVLTAIPASSMKESVDLQECGFTLLRMKKPVDAVKFFELAVTRFPNEATNYYYRGLSEWQIGAVVEKPGTRESRAHFDKAKADMTKFVEMAPEAAEAANAKKILEIVK
jgi:predicted Zn-dependent protease